METLIVESPIPIVSSPVLTACLNDSPKPSSKARLISKRVPNQEDTPSLDNILLLTNRFEDILGVTTSSDEIIGVEANRGVTIMVSEPGYETVGSKDLTCEDWMVNTRTDADLSAAVQNALQTLLPQIRAEIREEFRTSSGPSDAGGNPPPVTIHTWLERFNKQKPHSFEKATAPVDAKNWISHMEKIFDVMGCEDAFKTRLVMYKFEGNALAWWTTYKQAKGGDAWLIIVTWADFKNCWYRGGAGNHLMCMSYTDVALVANAARNYEILHERDDDDTERPDKRQKSGDRHQPTSQQSSHRNQGHNNDRHGSDRQGASGCVFAITEGHAANTSARVDSLHHHMALLQEEFHQIHKDRDDAWRRLRRLESLVKENQENDKIRSKPDKNGKRGEAKKSLKQLQLKEEEKPKKTKKRIAENAYAYQKLFNFKEKKKRKGPEMKFFQSSTTRTKTANCSKLWCQGLVMQMDT
nr:zinc finger, CCHC-type, retrotransposon Gag domain protein [Tanacetum cinerariifolium]